MFSLQSNQDQAFIKATLEKQLRLDGRDLHEYRPIRIKFSGCTDGIAQISIGNTKVLAKSSKKMVNPRKGKPAEGNYRFQVNFSHLQLNAEQNNKGDQLWEHTTELQRLLEKVFLSSWAIDCESLCISSGKLVWEVSVEVIIQCYDGNMIDSVFFAALLSLGTTKIP